MRASASASAISFFTVLQLLVYAGLQIPVGLLVDRFGSRAMIAGLRRAQSDRKTVEAASGTNGSAERGT